MGHALDDTQSALNTVRQLKSRGVTRYYDLNQTNRQNLADVEDDEHGEADALESASDHEMAPPRQRPRSALSMPDVPDIGEPPQAAPQDPQPDTDPQALPTPEIPAAQLPPVPMSPGSLSQISQEPSEEPPIPSGQPTPHAATAKPELDPQTAALYETAELETFQQRRLRFNQQETLSFAPWRTRHPALEHEHAPQAAAAAEASATQTATPITGEQLPGQAFQVEDLKTRSCYQLDGMLTMRATSTTAQWTTGRSELVV